jgi:hypothetical protein
MNSHPERKIQHSIMNWCREQGLKCYATANGQWLNDWNEIRERAMMGKGLSDLIIIIPGARSESGMGVMVAMECKSATGRLRPEQREFLELVNSIKGAVSGTVVRSIDEAISYLSPMLREPEPMTDE